MLDQFRMAGGYGREFGNPVQGGNEQGYRELHGLFPVYPGEQVVPGEGEQVKFGMRQGKAAHIEIILEWGGGDDPDCAILPAALGRIVEERQGKGDGDDYRRRGDQGRENESQHAGNAGDDAWMIQPGIFRLQRWHKLP